MVDQTIVHYATDGWLLYKGSEEAKRQLDLEKMEAEAAARFQAEVGLSRPLVCVCVCLLRFSRPWSALLHTHTSIGNARHRYQNDSTWPHCSRPSCERMNKSFDCPRVY
jgi:hypothetical protein